MEKEQSVSWLQRLKDESWEAELLVSVASIFAIMNAFFILDWLVDFFINHLQPSLYFYAYMISFFGYLALGILGSFFVIHFSLRAYWIGLVGLNSVFPDYSLKDSAYSEIYTKKMSDLLPKVPATINTLDEICSVIFSAAFALLTIYLYLGALCGLMLAVYSFAGEYIPSIVLLFIGLPLLTILLLSTIGTVVANFKSYKQNERLQNWFFSVVVWNCRIFYGPFYKYIQQIIMMFASNYKRKSAVIRSLYIMVLFGVLLATVQISQSNVLYLLRSHISQDTSKIYPENYFTNNTESTFLLAPEIQSPIISENAITLFVPIFESEVNTLEKQCKLNERSTKDLDNNLRQIRWRENLDCYATSINISINESDIIVEFIKMNHSVTGQFGLFAFVNLNDIKQGSHLLSISKTVDEENERKWKIPFYFSSN